MRAGQARRRRRHRILAASCAALCVAAILGGIAIYLATNEKGTTPQRLTGAVSQAAHAGTAQPPWPRPADTEQRAAAAGLAVGASEGTAVHFHAHLDVFVDAKPVAVPADLGLGSNDLAELHTHDTSGVLHIEAPANGSWVLGQLFDEWNVRLNSQQIGGLKVGHGSTLRVYVNGRQVNANPATVQLKSHEEIAVVYGSPSHGPDIPTSYAFPQGE